MMTVLGPSKLNILSFECCKKKVSWCMLTCNAKYPIVSEDNT